MAVLSRNAPGTEAAVAPARTKLFAAVNALVAERRPYAELTVEEIARRAGLSRATFYLHFRDKRELLLAFAESVTQPLLARLGELRLSDASPSRDGLAETLQRALALAREHASAYQALLEASTYDQAVAAVWRELNEQFIDAVAARVEVHGTASPVPPRAVALALVSMIVESCFRQVSYETGVGDGELAEALALVWYRGAYGTPV